MFSLMLTVVPYIVFTGIEKYRITVGNHLNITYSDHLLMTY